MSVVAEPVVRELKLDEFKEWLREQGDANVHNASNDVTQHCAVSTYAKYLDPEKAHSSAFGTVWDVYGKTLMEGGREFSRCMQAFDYHPRLTGNEALAIIENMEF